MLSQAASPGGLPLCQQRPGSLRLPRAGVLVDTHSTVSEFLSQITELLSPRPHRRLLASTQQHLLLARLQALGTQPEEPPCRLLTSSYAQGRGPSSLPPRPLQRVP